MGEDRKEKEKILQEEKIKKEFNRLRRIFKDIPKNKMDTAISLIRNAAFMTITLDSLQQDININGPVSEYQNGENQWGTKKSPEVEIYNTMIKNHLAVIKQLCDLLPDGGNKGPGTSEDEKNFLNFIKGAGG